MTELVIFDCRAAFFGDNSTELRCCARVAAVSMVQVTPDSRVGESPCSAIRHRRRRPLPISVPRPDAALFGAPKHPSRPTTTEREAQVIRSRGTSTRLLAAASLGVLVFVAGCAGSQNTPNTANSVDEGTPVSGGSAHILQVAEPMALDPAKLSNTWAHTPTLGNALYGELMVNDTETFEVGYKMATDFSSTDGGLTFNLVLRPGLEFTDGTPLDAEAVRFNWERLKDPQLGSTSIRQARMIAALEVVEPTVLEVTMTGPNPYFAEALVAGALNWIASPTALQKGQQAFDENPVGAGPFVLTRWTRQGEIELERNPGYWDAPKPYLDRITLQAVPDASQRLNAVATGAADLASESNAGNIGKAEMQGLQFEVVPTGGGQMIAMNHRRAPFDDPRARRAVQLALDTDALNTVVYNGEGEVPAALFPDGSPFYSDIDLQGSDSAEAQRLFDELADEGKPVSFSFMSYPSSESKVAAEAVQAQLSSYDNVEMRVEMLDIGGATARAGNRDFDMTITTAIIQDPDFPLWMAFHSQSPGNFVGIDDPQLDAALDLGRVAPTPDERKAAYRTAQERIKEVVPGVWYTRAVPAAIYGPDVRGVEMYTLGSIQPEELWMNP
ncbi:ABC transporter substrate-binding protein [Rhodococcus triatomae]